MRRTQLYLDDHLWNALHTSARSRKTTVSELVREAVRERYLGARDEQSKAMQEFVGTRGKALAVTSKTTRLSTFEAFAEALVRTGLASDDGSRRFRHPG